jgi:ParB-like chromosome segregation protein Spo0J
VDLGLVLCKNQRLPGKVKSLETNSEVERARADERARRLEQARMEGLEEARVEEQRRRKAEEARSQQQRLQVEAQARMEAEKNMSETKKFEAVNKAISASDDNYVPPQTVLDSKSLNPLLEQVDGPSLLKYDGKEATYSGRSTKVYGGSTLDIPIRDSAPGSIVEYTIEKKSYDFGLGIIAKLDQGGTTIVKPMTPFDGRDVMADRPRQKTQSDQVLVGAGSVPCTLNFKFENKFSWITEVSYKIRVIPPSAELLLAGRRRRAAASMQALDNDIGQTNIILNEVYNQGSILQNEVDTLTQQVQYMESNLQQTREEEWSIRNMEEEASASRTGSSNRFEF